MGRPDFEIIQLMVQYDEVTRKPVSVKYWDQEGCGHESPPIPLDQSIEELTRYHLRHARVSHEMVMPNRCPVEVSVGDGSVMVACTRDVHGPELKHAFQW